jgi:hypothetical protein
LPGNFLDVAFKWLLAHLSPRYLFALAVLSGFLLFAPKWVLAYFAAAGIASAYRGWISLLFAGCVLLLLTYLASAAWNFGGSALRKHRAKKRVERNFETLGKDQIMILSRYVQSSQKCIDIPMADDAAAYDLIRRGILYRPTQRGSRAGSLSYCVSDEAAPFLEHTKFQAMLDRRTKRETKELRP